ncbi:PilZ domain-containing protein [Thiolapillus sp.]
MNKTISLPELRKNARVCLSIEYELQLNGQQYTGETGDISLGGASLRTSTPELKSDQALENGQILLVLGEDRLLFDCMIVYVGSMGASGFSKTGITFKNVSDKNKSTLLKYMMRHL